MLVVQSNSTLDGIVADHVAMSKILGYDARARLVFLGEVMLVARSIFGICAGKLADASRAGDLDLRTAELGVIEEEGCLCGSLFLEGDSCALGAIRGFGGWGDGEGGNLAAVGY